MIDIIIGRNKNLVKKEKAEYKEQINNDRKGDEKIIIDDDETLVNLLEQRLQFILRTLTKICLNKSAGSENKE